MRPGISASGYHHNMTPQTGTPIPQDQAWGILDRWKVSRSEIGILFFGKSGTVCTSGSVSSARNGKLQFNGETSEASFNLKSADFLYGPVLMFPHYPSPPPVEVI